MRERKRCEWCNEEEIYQKYHDDEWGVPVYDDRVFFEFLILEGSQAGLSWITILRRRENYRRAFDGFDVSRVALYDNKKIDELLKDEGIIRNKLKVRSAVRNAKVFIEIQKEFGSFSDYIWGFVDGKQVVGKFKSREDMPVTNELSDRVSKDLKKRGMSFVGSTIIYSFLEDCGIMSNHEPSCFLN